MNIYPGQEIVKQGTFLYADTVTCDIRIVKSPIRFGSGDHEAPPEIAEDRQEECYYIQFGSTTERDIYNAGSIAFSTVAEALQWLSTAPGIGRSVQWLS